MGTALIRANDEKSRSTSTDESGHYQKSSMAEELEEVRVFIEGGADWEESILVGKVQRALRRGSTKIHIIHGYVVDTNSDVRILTGPVIGEVTTNSAFILLEVQGPEKFTPVTCKLYKDPEHDQPVAEESLELKAKRPSVFQLQDLEPNTRYTAVFNGVCKYNATHRMAHFKTKSEHIEQFRILALSCDRPSRLLMGQQDPWMKMLKGINNVDVILHVGDQIYPDNEDIGHADAIFGQLFDELPEDKQRSMMLRGRELWRSKYRAVFSRKNKVSVLANCSNLMIWSDNDVANDFTTLRKEDGSQMYHPNFLQCGMRTYREYQRKLWDPDCSLQLEEETKEWHQHIYGPVAIFMCDLRGNRISGSGHQAAENNLLSDEQWSHIEALFENPDIKVIILCSETPFVGDEPSVCRQKVEENPSMDFLRDHWPYNEDELIRLLDLCFNWKAAGEADSIQREVLLIGGDIHCGVTSVIRDDNTGLQINQLTTSPVTNHVCKFFPPSEGVINERYNFSHLPLGQKFRNYADIQISVFEDQVNVQGQLIPISTDIFKDTTWKVEDSEEE